MGPRAQSPERRVRARGRRTAPTCTPEVDVCQPHPFRGFKCCLFTCLVTLRKYPGAKPNLTLTLTHTYRCSAAMLGASPRVRCVCASFLSAPLAGSPSSAPLSCGEVSMIHLSDETFYASR